MKISDRLILAMDNPEEINILDKLKGTLQWVKLGSIPFTHRGPAIVSYAKGLGYKVMLDLKYHDIPNTVEKACIAASNMGVDMLTIHISGGKEMIDAALNGCSGTSTKIIGISVLTSLNCSLLNEVGHNLVGDATLANLVIKLVTLGYECGLDGIVCSAHENDMVRSIIDNDVVIINPGVRMPSEMKDDQKRVSTPWDALNNGANYIVMGRSLYNAKDPLSIINEIENQII